MNNLVPVKFNDEVVITTKLLAEVYECEESNIKKNFNSNKDKFEEGKHYYKLEGEELKKFKEYNKVTNSNFVEKQAKILYLWTKRGASRHCKMLGTDKAWDMFDSLEENYFNPKVPQLTKKQELQLTILNGSDMERVSALKEYEKVIQEPLIKEIEEKETIIHRAIDDDGLFDIGVVGKLLKPYCKKMGAIKIFKFLRENKILIDKPYTQKHNNPYDKYYDYFEIKVVKSFMYGEEITYTKTYFNGKGLKWFLNKLAKEGYIQKSEIENIKSTINEIGRIDNNE